MNYTGSAPVRQPVPELPEGNLPGTPAPPERTLKGGKTLAYLKVLWDHRGLLCGRVEAPSALMWRPRRLR